MLVKISEDENHNKIAKPIAGATLGQGVPLGTWCSFEKDVAPSSNWLVAGTTFDASVYPALNLYLGTNVVPSRYDHNRPSEKMPIDGTGTIQFTLSTTNSAVPYDGIITFGYSSSIRNIYVNDVIKAKSAGSGTTTISVKKGDLVRVNDSIASETYNYAQWYTHPLFIKATSIASDSDKDSILAQIQEYNTYSTEETLTGKTWIDGKPIYRKCISMNITSSTEEWNNIGYQDTNIDVITDSKVYYYNVSPYNTTLALSNSSSINTDNNKNLVLWHRNWGTFVYAIIEYTKTTD